MNSWDDNVVRYESMVADAFPQFEMSEENVEEAQHDPNPNAQREVATDATGIPKNYYEAKKLTSQLGLEAVKIDCCVNGYMLYYKEDEQLRE
ncbi:hypothetical protein PIB30_114412, partial [Stylosanthes scabra]|nr:hypothetical protein [Stylosanthes scabra]